MFQKPAHETTAIRYGRLPLSAQCQPLRRDPVLAQTYTLDDGRPSSAIIGDVKTQARTSIQRLASVQSSRDASRELICASYIDSQVGFASAILAQNWVTSCRPSADTFPVGHRRAVTISKPTARLREREVVVTRAWRVCFDKRSERFVRQQSPTFR